jgi:uncharacterized RDD family membrane protein YckC
MPIQYDARDRFLARRDKGEKVEVVTPEGTPLPFTIAPAGDRMSAFFLDALILFGAIIVIVFLAVHAFGMEGLGSWIGVFVQLALFLGGNFYFTIFEMRWQGRTPGKRVVGIRVCDAAGGPLTADAVIARNLMRQLEIFIPFALIANPDALWPGASGWVRTLCCIWLIAFALMPLWNKHRMRIGDLVAGTIVVLAPKSLLLEDIGSRPVLATAAAQTTYSFATEQLDVYGIYELQVLEDLLRDVNQGKSNEESVHVVCEKIKTKIRWNRGDWKVNDWRFLSDFYTALRARLEQKMLFGKKKADKHAK